MLVRISPEAEADLTEAREWYSHQRANLDLEFMQSIDEALALVVSSPNSFPVVYRTLRRAIVRRFPFAIFYEVTVDEIQVTAIFHSRRNPEMWQSRVS
ncbi:MAG TPA: type II toxin-antitoxin system RelE/ParE family toxin [Pyrinomonadaceae bacterium]|jgi:plasmid stabilization system protein ParE